MNLLIIFVKAPGPGRVKTRLAAEVGETSAVEAYRWMVAALLNNLEAIREIQIRYSPDDALVQIQSWLRLNWSATPQGTGDLGRRLITAFEEAFSNGAERVVVIGSDCPTVEPADIESAWMHLGTADVVLGPAADGGYWLIGLRRPIPELFIGIPWSTDSVFRETLDRIRQAGLSVELLRVLHDIDTAEDWLQFRQTLNRER